MSTVPIDLPLVLTVEEAAAVLRIGRGACYEAVRTGAIPSLKIGRTIRVPRARMLELLGEPEHQPTEGPGGEGG